jgi:NTP pyrophosphatase (non-canonical NTP hydrolase)
MIDLHSLQDKIVAASDRYAKLYGVDRSGDWVMLKLAEEAGELMQTYIRATGRSRHGAMSPQDAKDALSNEVADLIGMCLVLAHQQSLDLAPALERKWRIDLSAG